MTFPMNFGFVVEKAEETEGPNCNGFAVVALTLRGTTPYVSTRGWIQEIFGICDPHPKKKKKKGVPA